MPRDKKLSHQRVLEAAKKEFLEKGCKVDSRGIIYIVLELIHMRKSKPYIPNNYLEEMINDFLTCGINRYITKN